MKKIVTFLILFSLALSLSAQYDMSDVEASFQSFADETANALPLAAAMGLNWNDAYVGKFPHLGIGLTMGAVMLPSEAFEEVWSLTGGENPLGEYAQFGIPLPVYSFDFRIGLPVIPFDVGFKLGIITPGMLNLQSGDIVLEYKMIGGDVRWAILEDKKFLPDLSVGFAYTWLNGGVTTPMPDQTISLAGTGAGNELTMTDSDLLYNWSSNVMDFKVQVSKKILLLQLSAGAGYSYGFSTAGGGMTAATVEVDGTPINSSQIDDIEAATGVSIDEDGLTVLSEANGGNFRLFGGVGLNIFFFKIDLGLLYGLPSQTMGLTANVRLQF